MNFKKSYTLILTAVAALSCSIISYAQTPDIKSPSTSAETPISQQQIIDEIYERTGVHVTPASGSTLYVNPEKVSGAASRATTIPTKEAPSYPATGNWSNTKNYTYTKYYFRAGTFSAEASARFDTEYYKKDGTYIMSSSSSSFQQPSYRDGATLSSYYYVKIINGSSSASSNASWTAQ